MYIRIKISKRFHKYFVESRAKEIRQKTDSSRYYQMKKSNNIAFLQEYAH